MLYSAKLLLKRRTMIESQKFGRITIDVDGISFKSVFTRKYATIYWNDYLGLSSAKNGYVLHYKVQGKEKRRQLSTSNKKLIASIHKRATEAQVLGKNLDGSRIEFNKAWEIPCLVVLLFAPAWLFFQFQFPAFNELRSTGQVELANWTLFFYILISFFTTPVFGSNIAMYFYNKQKYASWENWKWEDGALTLDSNRIEMDRISELSKNSIVIDSIVYRFNVPGFGMITKSTALPYLIKAESMQKGIVISYLKGDIVEMKQIALRLFTVVPVVISVLWLSLPYLLPLPNGFGWDSIYFLKIIWGISMGFGAFCLFEYFRLKNLRSRIEKEFEEEAVRLRSLQMNH